MSGVLGKGGNEVSASFFDPVDKEIGEVLSLPTGAGCAVAQYFVAVCTVKPGSAAVTCHHNSELRGHQADIISWI